MAFLVVECPFCNIIFVREVRNTKKELKDVRIKCIKESCNKSRQLKLQKKEGLAWKFKGSFYDAREAQRLCAHLKLEQRKGSLLSFRGVCYGS